MDISIGDYYFTILNWQIIVCIIIFVIIIYLIINKIVSKRINK